jgi:anthranilate synthase/aminodeoxychorismate synthase-like glutamine amidotransferase
MILLIDNYDSFTFNLFQMIEHLGQKCLVVRNDQITLKDIAILKPEKIVLSPGPGNPASAGITLSVIEEFKTSIPIFGVCLGHQAIGQAFGGSIVKAKTLKHGKQSKIYHNGQGVLAKIKKPFLATRYHSLVIERETLPSCLQITCETKDKVIMGVKHCSLPIEGVQFHPESIATEHGTLMLKEFLERKRVA